jgi:hypothetical protein
MKKTILFLIVMGACWRYTHPEPAPAPLASWPKMPHWDGQEVLQIAHMSDPIPHVSPALQRTAASAFSEDQLTAILVKEGYQTARAFEGSHYFTLRRMNQGRRSGLSGEMRVFYDVSSGTVTLAAEIRPLEARDPAGIADIWNADRAPLLRATYVVVPAPQDAAGRHTMQDTILAVKTFDAGKFTAETARGIRDLFVAALTPGSELWPQ